MSNYKKHIVFGVLTSIILYYLLIKLSVVNFNLEELVVISLISVMYSILPDIDIRTSKAYGIFIFSSVLIMMLLTMKGEILYSMIVGGIVIAVSFLKHRGITHSILFGIISSLPLFLIGNIFPIFGFVSFLSHKVLDTFNVP